MAEEPSLVGNFISLQELSSYIMFGLAVEGTFPLSQLHQPSTYTVPKSKDLRRDKVSIGNYLILDLHLLALHYRYYPLLLISSIKSIIPCYDAGLFRYR